MTKTLDPISDLRSGTRDLHRSLEAMPVFMRLMSNNVTLEDYERALLSLQITYSNLEPRLITALKKWAPDYPYIPRLPLLQRDLVQLGIHDLPLCEVDTWDELDKASPLGALYVIDGSARGGKLLLRHLESRLGSVITEAMAFYGLNGKLESHNWAEIQVFLHENLITPSDIDLAVLSAQQVFLFFHRSAESRHPLQ